MKLRDYFRKLLKKNSTNKIKLPKLTKRVAKKIIERIKIIKLHSHEYAFTLNFHKGNFDIINLLDFAYENGLDGININVNYGLKNSLRKKTNKELRKIKLYAENLKLEINLELSSASKKEVDAAAKIARVLGVRNIRVYIRQEGHISVIIKKGIEDLMYIKKIAKDDLYFVLEQHEVLKSNELVGMIKKVNSSHVRLLFDFGNMINANEDPIEALYDMSPYITQVHLKGVKIVKIKRGFKQVGTLEGGEGDDLPQMRMLFTLLLMLLGTNKPQIMSYALEQEVGYVSPPFRFDDEGEDPYIKKRKASTTELNKNKTLEENLRIERKNAVDQVNYIRILLKEIQTMCKLIIKE